MKFKNTNLYSNVELINYSFSALVETRQASTKINARIFYYESTANILFGLVRHFFLQITIFASCSVSCSSFIISSRYCVLCHKLEVNFSCFSSWMLSLVTVYWLVWFFADLISPIYYYIFYSTYIFSFIFSTRFRALCGCWRERIFIHKPKVCGVKFFLVVKCA